MKKIIAVVQVQNEADIIESLCRYYCSFCDGIIVTDDISTDNTNDILKYLIEEGLPIYITNKNEIDHGLGNINARYQQLQLAVDKYDADIILPIDADEFLVCEMGGNPRNIIETMDEKIEYHIPWNNFICTKNINDNKIFFPLTTNKYVEPDFHKAIISKFLLKECMAFPEMGCHSFNYKEKRPVIIKMKELCYNHYPVRNKYQFMLKTIIGWTTRLLCPFHDGNYNYSMSSHWKEFFDEIKKHGIIKDEMLEHFSTYNNFTFSNNNNNYINERIFDISFCKEKINLHFTKYNEIESQFIKILTTQLENNIRNMPSWRSSLERKIAGEQLGQANEIINNLNNYIKILEMKMGPSKLYGTFYFDTGKGFNEDEKINFKHFIETKYLYNTVKLPQNTKSIRFDPVEGVGCYIQNLNILSDENIPVNYQILNGCKTDNKGILFTSKDPQILIDINQILIENLIVYCNIWFFIE
ncbi:MAG: glycosyltransferase family 2 protein [Treponema sp.]|nr:glycosyltransferase family 2 protein [Treponema sp.]